MHILHIVVIYDNMLVGLHHINTMLVESILIMYIQDFGKATMISKNNCIQPKSIPAERKQRAVSI